MLLNYYSATIYMCLMTLGVLCILARESSRIRTKDKWRYYVTYILIIVAALAEWGGMQLSAIRTVPAWPIQAVKCLDYVLTPIAGGALAWQMRTESRWHKPLLLVLAVNTVFQLVSVFTGWMVVLNDQHQYAHGKLYGVYVAVYLVVLVLVVAEFISYGQTYRRQNRTSLYAIVVMVLCGIAMQEVLGDGVRTAYIALTMGATLLFIHNTEFSLLKADDHIAAQQLLLATDALTGVGSRHAYSQALHRLEGKPLPEDLAALSIDINGLKNVNDTLGHAAGDELICGAAQCILKALGGTGQCYRTGGDEFVVLAHMDREKAEAALARLEQITLAWRGKTVQELRLAAGYALAADYPYLTEEKLVGQADQAMYAAKGAYYRQSGKDRRKR